MSRISVVFASALFGILMTGCALVSGGAPQGTPTLKSVSPSSAPAGSAGQAITVFGSNLTTGTVILVNGVVHPTTFVNKNQLRTNLTAADLAIPGTLHVSFQSSTSSATSGSGGTSSNPHSLTTTATLTTTTVQQSGSYVTFIVTTAAPLAISTTSLPNGVQSTPYSTALAANGGATPYRWNLAAGSLPAGLSLNSSTGAISGAPSAAGTTNFTIQVADSSSTQQTMLQALSIVVSGSAPPPTPLSVNVSALLGGTAQQPYTGVVAASGGTAPYSFSVASGSLPAGLTLNSSTGAVSGTPTTAGTYSFSIQAKDSSATANVGSASDSVLIAAATSGGSGSTGGTPPAGSFDQYGGRTDIACSQATGWFHTEKINNRWWLCTPAGNAYFFQGVAAWTVPTLPKYNNDTTLAASSLINEFSSWGFNGVGEMTYGLIEPGACASCKRLPEIQTISVSNYAAANLWNYAQRPMKNLSYGLNSNYGGWRASTLDFFEPQFGVWLDGMFANDPGFLSYKNNPYFIGLMLDDTDWFWGMGAGPDFHTVPMGHTNSHVGYMTLIASPVQTFNPDPASRGIPELYTDTKVYSKTAMPNPPATCSPQTPCSLRDYLYKKYSGSIAALNTAWGSNYTTFDSTGTQVTGEVIGTGNGTQTVFNATLAHSSVSPLSVLIKVGGVAQSGDCPYFQACNVLTGGSFSGPSTSTVAVGKQAWLSNIYGVNNAAYPAMSMWAVVTYHFSSGSGLFATPSRQVGQNFYNGGVQGAVMSPIDQTGGIATGYDVYVACRLDTGTTPAYGCASANSPIPTVTLQASNIPFGTDWPMPPSGLISGSGLPAAPSIINYSTGQVTLTFSTPPSAGQQITMDYIYNGWMYGSGLMDEDGRNTNWIGTNSICLTPALACDGVDNPKPNANPNLGADLDAWVAEFAGQYFGTLGTHLKAAAPHMLYLGADTVGTWGVPARKEILQGAAPYVDALFTNWFGNQPDAATATSQYLFLSKYLGDKPVINFTTLTASPDSAMSAYTDYQCCLYETTQASRGQQYAAIVSAMINTPSYNNTFQWVGISWWGSHDFDGGNGEHNDWGLKSPLDDAYDGHEAVSASVTCSSPLSSFACGGEVANFGDVITPVRAANLLWLSIH